jgi:hypothetical protein
MPIALRPASNAGDLKTASLSVRGTRERPYTSTAATTILLFDERANHFCAPVRHPVQRKSVQLAPQGLNTRGEHDGCARMSGRPLSTIDGPVSIRDAGFTVSNGAVSMSDREIRVADAVVSIFDATLSISNAELSMFDREITVPDRAGLDFRSRNRDFRSRNRGSRSTVLHPGSRDRDPGSTGAPLSIDTSALDIDTSAFRIDSSGRETGRSGSSTDRSAFFFGQIGILEQPAGFRDDGATILGDSAIWYLLVADDASHGIRLYARRRATRDVGERPPALGRGP